MTVNPIPDGYPRVMPYLIIDGAAAAIDFYRTVLGATERMRMDGPDGKIGHAELEIGDSVVMLADAGEYPGMVARGPKHYGGTPVSLAVYVADADKTFALALEHGAKETAALEDKFYGDRAGAFEDPWGHSWNVMTHIEDVAPDEMERRIAAFTTEG